MSRWKLFLILILAVVLLHILIIKIFIIGGNDAPGGKKTAGTELSEKNRKPMPEPEITTRVRKK